MEAGGRESGGNPVPAKAERVAMSRNNCERTVGNKADSKRLGKVAIIIVSTHRAVMIPRQCPKLEVKRQGAKRWLRVREWFRAATDNLVVSTAEEAQKMSETGWTRRSTVYIDHKGFGQGEREMDLCLEDGEEGELVK